MGVSEGGRGGPKKGAACDGPPPLCGKEPSLWPDNNVVDGDVDKLDEETNEAHDGKSNRRRNGNLLEFWNQRVTVLILNRFVIFSINSVSYIFWFFKGLFAISGIRTSLVVLKIDR